jgi:aspartate/methionine/tyrosine aminotransferase
LKHDLIVLSDEAYFDIRFEGSSTSIASLPEMQDRTVILYTFSKTYAMTGWRIGGAIGPKAIVDVIAKLNVNDESCTTHFIQWAAVEGLCGDQSEARAIVEELHKRRDKAHGLLNAIEGVRCFKPAATFYLFPNVSEAMARKGMTGYEEFRKAIMHTTGVSCCTRAHFGRPLAGESEYYLRFAYSGISLADIEEGLGRLKTYLESD